MTIQNTGAVGGLIKIGTETLIEAYTASPSNTSCGKVNIVIGDIPSTPLPGVTPIGVSVNVVNTQGTGSGAAYFGGIVGGVWTSAGGSTINVINRPVVFSTNAPWTIKLGGRVTITADPPVEAVPVGVVTAPNVRSGTSCVVIPARICPVLPDAWLDSRFGSVNPTQVRNDSDLRIAPRRYETSTDNEHSIGDALVPVGYLVGSAGPANKSVERTVRGVVAQDAAGVVFFDGRSMNTPAGHPLSLNAGGVIFAPIASCRCAHRIRW